MPGSIQSIERAAAIVQLLAVGSRSLRLSEISTALQLPRGTAHGILRTLTEVGFVEQDRVTGRYHLGSGLRTLGAGFLDVNELRTRSMNWTDPLAARTGEAARVGILTGSGVLVVHYVFRPDDSEQHSDVGAVLPAHATALGKVLLAYTPGTVDALSAGLASYTTRTLTERRALTEAFAAIRQAGVAGEHGEFHPDQDAIAAPIFGYGGLVVGAVGIHGDADRLSDHAGRPRARLVTQVSACAHAITAALQAARAAG